MFGYREVDCKGRKSSQEAILIAEKGDFMEVKESLGQEVIILNIVKEDYERRD